MQSGLGFLWLLSVIISTAAWLAVEIAMARSRKFPSRSGLTGYELARQVLDRHHLARTPVRPASARESEAGDWNQDALVLNEKNYFGTSLEGLSRALYSAVHLLAASKLPVPAAWRIPSGRFFKILVISSWVLTGFGSVLSGWSWALGLGRVLLILSFFLALVSLAGEWEGSERAVADLLSLERLWTDERVRMKENLLALRWTPLAEILGIPLRLLFKLPMKNKSEAGKIRTPSS